jgi:hypothetical protein
VTSQTANLTIAAGGTATCTYTNSKQGTITVIKHTLGSVDGTFAFTTSGAAPLGGGFNLTTTSGTTEPSSNQVFSNVPLGSYSVTESGPTGGFQFTSLTCSVSGTGTTQSVTSQTANITIAAGGAATCTYTNSKQGTITIIKHTNGGDGTFAFTTSGVAPLGGGFNLTTSGGTTDPNNNQVFSNVPLGSYSVTESAPPSVFQFTGLTCSVTGTGTTQSVASQTASITIAAGGTATCTYTNSKLASLTVIKICAPTTDTTSQFTVNITNASPLTVTCNDMVGQTENLVAGSYKLSEPGGPASGFSLLPGVNGPLPNGWTAPGAFAGDCDSTGNVTLNTGETKKCYLLNVSSVCTPSFNFGPTPQAQRTVWSPITTTTTPSPSPSRTAPRPPSAVSPSPQTLPSPRAVPNRPPAGRIR